VTAPLASDQPIAAPATFAITLDLNGSSGSISLRSEFKMWWR